MKNWIKLIIVLVVCIIAVGSVYIWRFGLPEFFNGDEKYIKSIYSNLVLDDETIEVKVEGKKIVFTKLIEEEKKETIEFVLSNGVVSTAVPSSISQDFMNATIKSVFVAATKLNGQEEEKAIYSIIPDVIADKTLIEDGYSLTTQNEVTRFSFKKGQKFNLANIEDIYIKAEELKEVEDIIKYRLQSKIIEKPGIVFEKAASYSKSLVFIIYEKDKLTDRSYNSFIALITTLLGNKLEYVKENYPRITRAGTLTLSGITISLNEKIRENNMSLYDKPDGYEYMVIRIDINEVER